MVKGARLEIRLEVEELAAIRGKAKAVGLTVSEWARAALVGGRVVRQDPAPWEVAEPVAVKRPSKAPVQVVRSGVDMKEIFKRAGLEK